MRKITSDAVYCFDRNKNFRRTNTMVVVHNDESKGTVTQMYLFGNLIAEKTSELGLRVCDGGYWLTSTTKDRLRGLGVDVYTRNHVDYLEGEEWNGTWKYVNGGGIDKVQSEKNKNIEKLIKIINI